MPGNNPGPVYSFASWAAIISFCLLMLATTIAAEDFIIIRDRSQVTVYDKYEQPIDPNDATLLAKGTPLRILERSVLLGDQITHAMRVSYFSDLYFLTIPQRTIPQTSQKQGSFTIYRNCQSIHDTIEIDPNGSFSIFPEYPNNGNPILLHSGDRLVRIFSYSKTWYVCTMENIPRFGWVTPPSRTSWKKIATTQQTDLVAAANLAIIRTTALMDSVNALYEKFYSHFNSITNSQKLAPRWIMTKTGTRIRWTLTNTLSESDLRLSTPIILQQIETAILGLPYLARFDKRNIDLEPTMTEKRPK